MSVGQIRIMERWGTLFEPWGAATGHILWPFWPKIAIFGHRHSQQPQMGWTLVEQGWTLYFTSGGVSLDPFCPPKMALGGPRTPQNDPATPNRLKVEEDIVEHIISHPGGSVITIKNTRKCLFWAQKVLKNGHFWPKIAIFGHRHSQQPRMDWRLVEHLISHPGGSVMTI